MARFSDTYPRFVAKVKDHKHPKVFYVYDREMGSWPSQRLGVTVQQGGTEEEMQAEASRLAAAYSGGTR